MLPAECDNWTSDRRLAVLLHELAHSLVAGRFKIVVRRITLHIFGGISELQDEPATAGATFWITLAGPLANLAQPKLERCGTIDRPGYRIDKWLLKPEGGRILAVHAGVVLTLSSTDLAGRIQVIRERTTSTGETGVKRATLFVLNVAHYAARGQQETGAVNDADHH